MKMLLPQKKTHFFGGKKKNSGGQNLAGECQKYPKY